jgi:hypothetical protein
MNINSDNNIFEDNIATTQSFDSIKDKNSEEDLVNDLKDSLHKSVDESLNMLNFLMQEIQDKVEDESVKEETKKLVNLLSENILNLSNTNTDKIGFNENFEQSNLEEE